MGGRKRTADERWDDAEANGHKPLAESGINGDIVLKELEDGTTLNYDRMLSSWDGYERRHPGATPHDLQTSKHFIEGFARSCRNGGKGVSMYYILQMWTDFIAGWKRRLGNSQIHSDVSSSIYNYIRGELRKKVGLSENRRARHFLTVPHVKIIIKQKWQRDWYYPKQSRILVYDHAGIMDALYTSARVGERYESQARPGSGRGLLYKDLVFVIFKNEKGEPEIALQTERDAKGCTHTPHKRPQHAMYEDMEPLYANPILPFLAIALADDAFQDYHTSEEIFAIPPPFDGTLFELRIKKELHLVPFFQTMSPNGPTGKIQKAASVAKRLVDSGHRAGYPQNIGFRATRREALVKADDNGYSAAQRMKFAGQKDPDVFFGSYMPQVSDVDGQSSFWGGKRRTVHIEALRGLSLEYHPQMVQSLPAKVQDDLAHRGDFVKINEEIGDLGSQLSRLDISTDSREIRRRRQELYEDKRQLVAVELSLWQSIQPRKITSEANNLQSSVACLPSYFGRVRRLDPPRDRLASSLFLDVSLRSAQGQSALRDMITLCRPSPKVAYRPSLQPENGRCPVWTCGREMDRIDITKRWDHIYKCYQTELAKKYGFAELCFQCDKWITSKSQWHEHCQHHLDDYESLPVQLNPLFFRRTLASAGHCLDCLFDSTLPPTKRFQQFTIKQSWREHTSAHWKLKREKSEKQLLYDSKPVLCPDLRCGIYFESVKDLQYHSQDVHCIDRGEIDLVKRRRRPKQYCHEAKTPSRSDDNSQNKFVNKTTETFMSEATNLAVQIKLEEEGCAVEISDTVNHYTPSTSAAPSPTSEISSLITDWASDTATSITEELTDCSDSDSPDDEESYEVERIVDHEVSYRAGNEEYLYKVRWAGYGPDDDEWISPESFNGLKMVEEYHQLHLKRTLIEPECLVL